MSLTKEIYSRNRWLVALGTSLVIASALANIATINFINRSIATNGRYFIENKFMLALLLGILFAFGVASQWMMTALSYRIIYHLRGRILAQVLQAEFEKIDALGHGKIYAALTSDVRNVQDGFVTFPFFVYNITLVIGGIAYMAWLSMPLTLLCVVILSLTMAIGQMLTLRFQRLWRKDRELEDDLFRQYEQILNGHKELVLNERRGDLIHRTLMEGDASQSRRLRTLADRYIVVNIHMMTAVTLGLIGLVFWALYHWHLGEIALGVSIALVLLFIRSPINVAISMLPGLLSARVSLRKLASLGLPEPSTRDLAYPLSADWQSLNLKGVGYRYAGEGGFELGPLDFVVKRGELIFVAGHNGAGKSTLTKMLIGLLSPTSGRICVDDIEVTDENRRHYRAMFSAVLTDFLLFDQVMAEWYGVDDDIRIQSLLHRLQLGDVVSVQDGKFSQTALSTGQRKRLAMVVACMERRSILVLDEWAADQDPYFRKIFYEEILPELKAQGITIIVVSHDDRYFHVADRVVTLSRGGLLEEARIESAGGR